MPNGMRGGVEGRNGINPVSPTRSLRLSNSKKCLTDTNNFIHNYYVSVFYGLILLRSSFYLIHDIHIHFLKYDKRISGSNVLLLFLLVFYL